MANRVVGFSSGYSGVVDAFDFGGTRRELARSEFLTKLLFVATCLLSIVPGLLTKVLVGARQQLVGQRVELPAIAVVAQYAAAAIALATCVVMVIVHVQNWRQLRGVGTVCAMLGLWIYIFLNDESFGIQPTLSSVIFPLATLAIWFSNPRLDTIRTLGYFAAAAATLSLSMGLFVPGVGLYVNSLGESPDSDKGIIPGPLLAGVFTSTNNLGQFLCLSLPAVFLVRTRLWRYSGVVVIVISVAWSGSRSSLVACGVVLLMMACRSLIKHRAASLAAFQRACVGIAVVCCVATPFVVARDPEAFSGRGRIWQVSLAEWESSPFRGLGSQWFVTAAKMNSGFGSRSLYLVFHGHNQVVQLLVTGGVVALVMFAAISFALWRRAGRGEHGWFISAYAVSFFISGTLELNLGVVDRFQFFSTALIPLLIVICKCLPDYRCDEIGGGDV